MKQAYWRAALPSAPHQTYTYAEPSYLPPDAWKPGLRVLVPVGGSTRMAVLVERMDTPGDLPKGVAVKNLLWPVEEEPVLDPGYMLMADNLASRQMEPVGRVLENLLPHGLRAVRFTFRIYNPRFPARLTPKALREQSESDLRVLAGLWADGRMRVAAEKRHEKQQEFCTVAKDPPWPVRPSAKRQMQVLEFLWDSGPVPRPQIAKELGSQTAQAVVRLIELGLVTVGPPPEFHEPDACALDDDGFQSPEPTQAQQVAIDDLSTALNSGAPATKLLYGVTGSGKTLVYLKLAEKALTSGKTVLLLAPEVALACALFKAASQHFPGRDVRLYHGYQQPAARERTFREVAAAREPQLIVGTRSALFLPVRDLGMVVLDEEHDSSFKQEDRMPYQAKEVAFFRVRHARGLLVLGSATPDVKTFQAAAQQTIGKVELPARVGDRQLPPIDFVDLREDVPTDGPFSKAAATALKETVENGDQAVIMLNRRGYAPVMYCLECGQAARCKSCDVGLTYHKARERLVCHYCGATEPFPKICECGCSNFLPMGEGTEQIEETLNLLLPPDTGVLRLDRDSTRRPGRMEEILDDFAARKAQVLVGTQMLSKGHNFPGVTLVTVADGDLGLNTPDYRAVERMFQLMVQVAGRAGRGEKPGRVLIQTRQPEHYCWDFVRKSDYASFFDKEIELRKKYAYPPFSLLALMRMNYPLDFEGGHDAIMQLVKVLGKMGMENGVRVLGPAPSPLGLLRGRKRYQCLLKGDDWLAIRKVYAEVRRRLSPHSKIRVSLDLDPVNML